MNSPELFQLTRCGKLPLRAYLSGLILAMMAALGGALHAQTPGSPDPGFVPDNAANNTVTALYVQGDGKIFINGDFTRIQNVPRKSFARLNSDGSLDVTYNPDVATVGMVANTSSVLTVQADGKAIVFGISSGNPQDTLIRLNPDGTRDPSFSRSADNSFNCAAALPSGRILVGGRFSSINGLTPDRFARLNADGTPDSSFNPTGVGPNYYVTNVTVEPDGKIFISGGFSQYNGVARNGVARLNVDGSLDTTFDPGTAANSYLTSTIVQPDGKYILLGNFTAVDGAARQFVARLNHDGSLDTTYAAGYKGSVRFDNAALQLDGRLIAVIRDTKTTFQPVATVRLDVNGNLDSTFNLAGVTYPSEAVQTVKVQTDGKILLGGSFSLVNGAARRAVVRLNSDLTPDTAFDAGSRPNSAIFATVVQNDGKVIVGGAFTTVRGGLRNRVARLNMDGTLDAAFDPGSGANSTVAVLALQPDGKLLLGGSFSAINGVKRDRIARLNADGTLDTAFAVNTSVDASINTLLLQPDGRIVVGGDFTTFNGVARNRLLRLNADGTLDASFNPGTGADTTVQTLALQTDGKVVVGGKFSLFNGARRPRLVRLNADGSIDTSFTGTAYPGSVNACLVQADGKVVIAGNFDTVNGVDQHGIARLNPDGSLDTTFNGASAVRGGGSGSDITFSALLPQTNGRILVAGTFYGFSSVQSVGLARLNADGTADPSFSTGTLLSGNYNYVYPIYGLALQIGNKVVATTSNPDLAAIQLYAGDGSSLLPVATTGTAMTDGSGTGATLSATINPNNQATNYYFQYGTANDYGYYTNQGSILAGGSSVIVHASLSGLSPNTTYHYRIVAFNSAGNGYGSDATFGALSPAQNWRQTYFGTTDNSGSAADSADPDGDGIPNLMERALGLNPIVANVSGLPKGSIDPGTGRLVLIATRNPDATDLTFSAETSADMVNWTTNGVTILTNTSTAFQASYDGTATARRFLRLRVTQP